MFNKTALGIGVLAGIFALYNGELLTAGFIFFVLVPVYFVLYERFVTDSQRENE